MIFVGMQGLGAASNANVKSLQEALNTLANFTGQTIYKVTVDGVMGPITANATRLAVAVVATELSSTVATIITAASIAMPAADFQKVLTDHAGTIATAIRAYIAKRAVSNQTPTPPPAPTAPAKIMTLSTEAINQYLQQQQQQTANPTANPTATSRIFSFDKKNKVYRIAQAQSGLSGSAPAFVEIAVSKDRPIDATEVTYYDYMVATGTLPWYRKWWGVTALGVGAAAIAIGTISVIRNRRGNLNGSTSWGRPQFQHRNSDLGAIQQLARRLTENDRIRGMPAPLHGYSHSAYARAKRLLAKNY